MSRRRSLAGPVALLVLLAAMTAFLAVNHLVSVRASRRWADHSQDVIQTAQTLFARVLEVESEERGYLLGRDDQLLSTFDANLRLIPGEMDALVSKVRDNQAQFARVRRLNAMLSERVRISQWRVELMRQGHVQEALSDDHLAGRRAMDGARAAMTDFMANEIALRNGRIAEADRADELGFTGALVFSVLALGGLAANLLAMTAANQRLEREIKDRIQAEAAQRESEALHRAIFANTADYLFVIEVTPDGLFKVAELNPALEAALGVTTAQARGRDIREIAPGRQAEATVEQYRKALDSRTPVFAREVYRLPGGRRTFETTLTAMRDAHGRVDRLVGCSRDITDREHAEEQLRRSHRMEAVGHLTGGVAHDFNNLLQVIRGNLELVARDLGDRQPAAQRLKNALRGAERAAQLTRQLLAFARRQPLEPRVVSLGRLVTDMAEMLRRTLGEAIEVETVIAGGLWNTLADPAQVESAVLNLAINARDAMPDGGRLTIEITNAMLDESYAQREADIEPGQYVLLAVSDTGQGMAPETLARVFEPFFTTKGDEHGTGLGLSMVYGFVKQSRGHVQIYSEPSQGTTVKIYLPRARGPEDLTEAHRSVAQQGANEVILVAEDDELVRGATVALLHDLGYACLEAANAAAALEIVRGEARIDLLFTDVIMPGAVKSRELAAESQRLRPGLPVLFTSGYTENAIVHHGRLDEDVQLLSKPYSREALARKIHGMLQTAPRVVLVVEDDPLVRLAAVDMIEDLGFAPLEAADASQALEILGGSGRIDILFTDIGLPGMRGPELAKEATALRPQLKIIFASGYGESAETSAIPNASHLGKPYHQEDLAEALSAAGAQSPA